MNTWFTSDLHFGHGLVANYRGFGTDVLGHDLHIEREWREAVREGDEVFVLGDIAVKNFDYALGIIACLPGVKHLIAGNHDPVHPCHNRAFKHQRRFLEVFESVNSTATLKIEGERVMLSHFPFTDDHSDPPRYVAWRPKDTGQWLIHGHTHSEGRITGPREIHVGVDAWDLKPVPLSRIGEIIRAVREIESRERLHGNG